MTAAPCGFATWEEAVASKLPGAHTSSPDGTVRFYPNMVLFPWLNGEGDASAQVR